MSDVDDGEVYVDEAFDDEPDSAPTPALPRRRRARMGQVIAGMGKAAVANPTSSVEKEFERRAHNDQAKRILAGGKNQGEAKGYGATAVAKIDRGGST